MPSKDVTWGSAAAYERFMGRWSKLVACKFVKWLEVPRHLSWFELGCGTGALTEAILMNADPDGVIAWEPSKSLLAMAVEQIEDERVIFQALGEDDLAQQSMPADIFVSGLVLNFLADPRAAVGIAASRLRPGGVAAAYVWDYSEGMEFIHAFWDVATELDPGAAELDQRARYPLCAPGPLRSLFQGVGLTNVQVDGIEIETCFDGFDEFWEPFLGGTGGAPTYIASLSDDRRRQLEASLRAALFPQPGAELVLRARAWAVRGLR